LNQVHNQDFAPGFGNDVRLGLERLARCLGEGGQRVPTRRALGLEQLCRLLHVEVRERREVASDGHLVEVGHWNSMEMVKRRTG
jgi:hypothetical protein